MLTSPSTYVQESFITQEEFSRFKKQLKEEFGGFKVVLDLQRRKIEELGSGWLNGAEEVKATLIKNHQIQEENKGLRLKIEELESSILSLQRQKSDFERNLNLHSRAPSPKFLSCFDTQESLSKLALTVSSQVYSQVSQPPKENSQKYLFQTQLTKQNQQAIEDDDEDRIDCVWEDSYRPNQKTDLLNNEKYQYNPHNKQFICEREIDRIRITKTNGANFFSPSHSFIHKKAVVMKHVSKYKVRKVKIQDIFLIGIASNGIIGVQNAFRHRELLAYSSNGDIWLSGDSKKTGGDVKQDQIIEMVVDRNNGTVSWSIHNNIQAKVNIPPQMLGKELFLTLLMFNKGDTLELLDCE